jgi:hypothetical protein
VLAYIPSYYTNPQPFAGRAATLSIGGGEVSGVIGPMDVQLYTLDDPLAASVTLNFEDRPAGETVLSGSYGSVGWGGDSWATGSVGTYGSVSADVTPRRVEERRLPREDG